MGNPFSKKSKKYLLQKSYDGKVEDSSSQSVTNENNNTTGNVTLPVPAPVVVASEDSPTPISPGPYDVSRPSSNCDAQQTDKMLFSSGSIGEEVIVIEECSSIAMVADAIITADEDQTLRSDVAVGQVGGCDITSSLSVCATEVDFIPSQVEVNNSADIEMKGQVDPSAAGEETILIEPGKVSVENVESRQVGHYVIEDSPTGRIADEFTNENSPFAKENQGNAEITKNYYENDAEKIECTDINDPAAKPRIDEDSDEHKVESKDHLVYALDETDKISNSPADDGNEYHKNSTTSDITNAEDHQADEKGSNDETTKRQLSLDVGAEHGQERADTPAEAGHEDQ